MEDLRASYGDTSSDSDSERDNSTTTTSNRAIDSNSQSETTHLPLPPPPLSLVNPPNSLAVSLVESVAFPMSKEIMLYTFISQFIYHLVPKKELGQLLKKVSSVVPGLHVVDADVPFSSPYKDDSLLGQVALGRELHISLGRTVPIRVHQIDYCGNASSEAPVAETENCSLFWIDFSKWEVFLKDDFTRTFLSIEVIAGGLLEITKQIQVVNEIYKLHNLPEFYKQIRTQDPRPHISSAWALGDMSSSLKTVIEKETKRLNAGGSVQKCSFSTKFSGIHCKIGNKTYKICMFSDE